MGRESNLVERGQVLLDKKRRRCQKHPYALQKANSLRLVLDFAIRWLDGVVQKQGVRCCGKFS